MKLAKIFFLNLLSLTSFACDAVRIITNKSGNTQRLTVTFHEFDTTVGHCYISPYSCEIKNEESIDLDNVKITLIISKPNLGKYTNIDTSFVDTKEIKIGDQIIYCNYKKYEIILNKNNELKRIFP